MQQHYSVLLSTLLPGQDVLTVQDSFPDCLEFTKLFLFLFAKLLFREIP